jgi:Kef-type K+ transport system membrane component KefB
MAATSLGFNRSMLLGAILGSTSPSVIISMIRHLKMASGPKVILILETAVTDVLCIIPFYWTKPHLERFTGPFFKGFAENSNGSGFKQGSDISGGIRKIA